jgi:hypothetical protein
MIDTLCSCCDPQRHAGNDCDMQITAVYTDENAFRPGCTLQRCPVHALVDSASAGAQFFAFIAAMHYWL